VNPPDPFSLATAIEGARVRAEPAGAAVQARSRILDLVNEKLYRSSPWEIVDLLACARSLVVPGLLATVSATGCGGSSAARGDAGPQATPPSLSQLTVSRGETAVALVPAFSPNVHDYYVGCAAGTNAFTVSMTAAAGARALLTKPETSPAAPQQMLSIQVLEDGAIVAVASDGTATSEYWVRCLPHDFPEISMATHPEAGTPLPGYYLVGNRFPTGASAGYAMVLNTDGVPV
jgi:hypothetical protein